MREIDFLPDWYIKTKKKKSNYRMQYAVIAVFLAILSSWMFFAGKMVSRTDANIQVCVQSIKQQEQISSDYSHLKDQLSQLQSQKDLLDKVDSKVSFKAVLAQLSGLINDNIVIKNIKVESEEFEQLKRKKASTRILKKKSDANVFSSGPVRYKISITGLAKKSGDVADLINRLEQSSAFCEVIPGFTRNRQMEDTLVSEFELSCCVANYVITLNESEK